MTEGTKEGKPTTAPTSISLLIPAYNEEATLAVTVERCLRVVEAVSDDFEVVILDDASRDRTAEIAESLRLQHPTRIRCLRHETNGGIAKTFEDLYRAATKDYVYLISADNQFPPEAIFEIIPLLNRFDIVVCKRVTKPYTWWRRTVSNLYRRLPRVLFGVELYDAGSVKCMKREIVRDITVTSRGVFVDAERLIRAGRRGSRIGAMEIVQAPRQAGVALGARFPVVAVAAYDLIALWIRLIILRQKP